MLNSPNTSDMLGDMSLESATPKTRGRKSLKVNNKISDFLIKKNLNCFYI